MSSATSLHQILFAAEGVEPGAARVCALAVREGLSRPFTVDLELDFGASDVDPEALLLRPATAVVAKLSDGTILRRFTGVVTRVREHARPGGAQRVGLTLEAPLALLRLGADYRIFQAQTTQQIVSTLLDEAGITAPWVAWRLVGSYPKREVCTQVGESGFAFVSRLLEEDGIFYFHEHGEDGEVLVFADTSSGYSATRPSTALTFRSESGLISEQTILTITERARIRPAKVTLRDHDFKRPSLDLEATAEGDAPLGREHYAYPGRYVDPAEGKRRAQIRLEALQCEAAGVSGSSTAFSLTPGHTFTLSDAPDPSLDKEWVVRDVAHAWTERDGGVRFENRFELLPVGVQFRPPSVTPRPIVPGPQLATVTGPAGEEIHCDELGRVKVHFPWDRRSRRDDRSSCWVRVGQMHSSGAVAIPRVGWEVLVDFEDGDPDKPIVVGRLYNGAFRPPYALPTEKTVSSLLSTSSPGGNGFNEIRMNDAAGGEQLHVHAQRDHNVKVANDKTEKVANNASHSVGANHKLTVGANETVQVGGKLEHVVGASQTWAVGASRTKTVGGNEEVSVKGDRSLSIGGSHTTMTPMSVSVSTPASLSETVGGSCLEAAALDVGMMAAGAASVTVGAAKIEAVATGKSDLTVGARASTVGGAFISASGKDVGVTVGGAKATTVGGAWAASASGDLNITSGASLSINVGGAVSMNAATIVLKVGGSNVTLSGGSVAIKSSEIKLTATGPQPELAPIVSDA